MIFILTILFYCRRYLNETIAMFNSEDAKERPWVYDHTAVMGAGIGFIAVLFKGTFYGAIGEVFFWVIIMKLVAHFS